jgi:hypothetical protein
LTAEVAEEIIPWSDQNREEVLTDTAAAQNQ